MISEGQVLAAYMMHISLGSDSGKQTRIQPREIQRAFVNDRRDRFYEIDDWQEELIGSQASVEPRPQLLEVLELAKQSELTEVTVNSENCLSSDPLEFFSIQKSLQELSVRLLVVLGGQLK